MARKITLYPIYWLGDVTDDQPFDRNVLPFRLLPDVRIEDVSPMFGDETWDWVRNELGRHDVDHLRDVHFAIVHRYETGDRPGDAAEADRTSEQLVRNLAALMRLLRPMRQSALLMRGHLRTDNTLDVQHFQQPVNLMEVPEVQKLFHLRNRDAEALCELAPEFLRAMAGEFWKFRMAVDFHEAGHFQDWYWKARYSLWCSALESIYTSEHPEHRGSTVAKERIKWFLGAATAIYPPGDIPAFWVQSDLTVADMVDDIYDLRNFIAHGDKVPDEYFHRSLRRGAERDLNVPVVCLEAVSFIVRNSLLKILRERLLDHFASATSAEPFFAAGGLTNTAIRQRQRQQQQQP